MPTGEDGQRTIEDYLAGESHESDQHRNGGNRTSLLGDSENDEAGSDWPAETIGFNSPTELLEHLGGEKRAPENNAEIISRLARYLDGTHPSSSNEARQQAREALERILKTADHPVNSPDLFRLLDNESVDRELVLEHTLELVPVPLE